MMIFEMFEIVVIDMLKQRPIESVLLFDDIFFYSVII
jgi:hypothetical protein